MLISRRFSGKMPQLELQLEVRGLVLPLILYKIELLTQHHSFVKIMAVNTPMYMRLLAALSPDAVETVALGTREPNNLEHMFEEEIEPSPKRVRVDPDAEVIDLTGDDPEIIDLTGDTEGEDADWTDDEDTVTCDEFDGDDPRDPDWLPSDEEAIDEREV